MILQRLLPVIALSVISIPANAAWSLEPSYYLRAERSDNIYLATDNELAVTGGTFSPRLAVIMEEETRKFTGDVELSFTRYQEEDQEQLDRDEGKLGLDWRKGTELSMFSISGGYSSQSSLDPRLDVNGITDQQVDVLTTSLAPSWRYQFAERWALMLNLSYTDVEYDEPGYEGFENFKIVNFINYTNESVGITLVHNITEQDDISLAVSQARYSGQSSGLQYDYDQPIPFIGYFASERQLNYDNIYWQLGYTRRFNEINEVNIQAGKSNVDVENLMRQTLFVTSTGLSYPGTWEMDEAAQSTTVYNFSYKYKTEISTLEFAAGRNRVASSTGGLDETDTAKIYYYSGITERLSWALDISHVKSKPDANTNALASAESERTNVAPSVLYKLDQDWSMSLGYMYSERDAESDADPAKSNTVFFTMSWRDPQFVSTN